MTNTNKRLFLSRQKLPIFIYIALMGGLIFDIGGAFGVKHFITILMVFFAAAFIFKVENLKPMLFELNIIFFFLIGFAWSLILGISISSAWGVISFIVYFPLIMILVEIPRDRIVELFYKISVFSAVIVIATFIFIYLAPDLSSLINSFGNTYRLGYLGLNPSYESIVPNVYYRWSMWLIPAFIIGFGRKNISALIIFSAIVATLSTSLLFFSLLGALVLFLLNRKISRNTLKKNMVLFFVLLVVFLFNENYFFSYLGDMFSKFSVASESTNVKIGHIASILNVLSDSVLNFLFGTGAGSKFYSLGINAYTSNVEVSHFNFARQFGVVGFLMFFSYVMYAIFSSFRTDFMGRRLSVALIMLFLAAGTNPLLMSPVFIVFLVIVRAYSVRFYKERDCL
jgi:hypothetical protein